MCKMKNRPQIQSLAYAVGDVLNRYVEVHNYVQDEGASTKSLVKNFFGRGKSQLALLADAEALLPGSLEVERAIDTFRTTAGDALSDGERQYVDVLTGYARALSATIEALIERQQVLHKVSTQTANWTEFSDAGDRYEASIKEYMAWGQQLNDLAPLIFD